MSSFRRPVDDDFSAAHALAGPSRARADSRQARTSLSKPYARKSTGSVAHSTDRTDKTPSRQADAAAGQEQKTPTRQSSQSPSASPSSGGGLLSGLRQAIFSRPLSWLQRGAPGSETLASSKTNSSLVSSEQRSAAQKLQNSASKQLQNTPVGHQSSLTTSRPSSFLAPSPATPSRTSLTGPSAAFASRSSQLGNVSAPNFLSTPQSASSVRHPNRSPSPAHSTTSASAAIRSHGLQRLSVEPMSPRVGTSALGTPGYRRSAVDSPHGGGSVSGVSQAHSSASFAYGYGSERRLGGLTSSASAYGGGAMQHSPLAPSSSYGRLPSRSPFSLQRRSLGAGLSASASVSGSSRRRLGGASEFGQTSVHASPGTSFGGSGGLGVVTTPARPVSMFGGMSYAGNGSRAGSQAGSRMSSATNTPKRREWSSLRIAPSSARRSEGEELMHEYMSMRNSEQLTGDHPLSDNSIRQGSWLSGTAEGSVPASPRPPPSELGGLATSTQGRSLKRDASMTVDGDEIMSDAFPNSNSQHPRKRQMVWDPQLGFVSRQEQRASMLPRPKPANNEAERLLNALEGMRTPLRDARLGGMVRSTNAVSDSIHVPLPTPSSSRALEGVRTQSDINTRAVSPYSRALRKGKLLENDEAKQPSMRERLRRQDGGKAARSAAQKRDPDGMSISSSQQNEESESEEEDDEEGEEEEEDDEEGNNKAGSSGTDESDSNEPPRRTTGIATRRRIKQDDEKNAHVLGAKPSAEPRVLRSGRVLQSTPTSSKVQELETPKSAALPSAPQIAGSASKPMSKARLGFSVNGASAANKQRAERQQLFGSSSSNATNADGAKALPAAKTSDNFSVRVDSPGSSTDSQPRKRSSLRQGPEKTSRVHVRSGRVGLDDDDNDDDAMEDSPSTDELNKIKLPTNLFPQGFTFANASSQTPSAAQSKATQSGADTASAPLKVAALPAPSDGQKDESETGGSGGGSSLLSRLGGFATPSEPPQQSGASPAPAAFSFNTLSAASATTSASSKVSQPPSLIGKPAFSFQPSVSSPLAGGSSTTQTPASDFFAAPKADDKKSLPASNGDRHDGPVPNFFASSLAKSNPDSAASQKSFSFGTSADSSTKEAKKPALNFTAPSASKSDTPSFGFTAPPSNDAATTKTDEAQSSAKPAFSFGTPAKEPATGAPSSTPFQGFGQAAKADAPSQSSPFTGFAAPQPSASTTAFSFGSSSTTSTQKTEAEAPGKVSFGGFGASSNKRRGDEDEESGAQTQKKAFGGFGSDDTPKQNSTNGAPVFSFGSAGKDTASASSSTSTSGLPKFSFGGAPSDDAKKATATPPTMQFGASDPSNKPSGTTQPPQFSGFGASFNAGGAGAEKTQSQGTANGFGAGFGSGTANNTTANSTPNANAPSKPVFSFKSDAQASSPSSQAPSSGGFSFGSASASSSTPAPSQQQQQSTGFGFGQTNNTNVFGNGAAAGTASPAGGAQSLSSPQIQTISANPFNSQSSSRQASPAPFAFGQPSSTPAQQGMGLGGFNQTPPATASNTAATPTFSFGSTAAQQPQQGMSGMNGAGSGTGSFSFSAPGATGAAGAAPPAQNAFGSGGGTAPSSPSVFVFGGSGNSGANSPAPGGAFQFGAQSQQNSAPAMNGAGGMFSGTPPPQPSSANALFNIGGPSSSSPAAGNRPVRQMPSRRRRA